MSDETKPIRRRKRKAPQRVAAGDRVNVTFLAPGNLYNCLVADAERTGASMSQIIEDALRRAYVGSDPAQEAMHRVVRETVRQEMRAEFEARREAEARRREAVAENWQKAGWVMAQANPLTQAYAAAQAGVNKANP